MRLGRMCREEVTVALGHVQHPNPSLQLLWSSSRVAHRLVVCCNRSRGAHASCHLSTCTMSITTILRVLLLIDTALYTLPYLAMNSRTGADESRDPSFRAAPDGATPCCVGLQYTVVLASYRSVARSHRGRTHVPRGARAPLSRDTLF